MTFGPLGYTGAMDRSIKKLSLYLETSVWNFIYADDALQKKDVTKKLFSEIKKGHYDIYISDAVVFEIGKTSGRKKNQLQLLIQEYNPIQLQPNDTVAQLTAAYLDAKVASTKSTADIAHIAYAVAYNLNVVVSWNLRHIVRVKTRMAVNGVNKALGYREIEIATPEEVIEYGST